MSNKLYGCPHGCQGIGLGTIYIEKMSDISTESELYPVADPGGGVRGVRPPKIHLPSVKEEASATFIFLFFYLLFIYLFIFFCLLDELALSPLTPMDPT